MKNKKGCGKVMKSYIKRKGDMICGIHGLCRNCETKKGCGKEFMLTLVYGHHKMKCGNKYRYNIRLCPNCKPNHSQQEICKCGHEKEHHYNEKKVCYWFECKCKKFEVRK